MADFGGVDGARVLADLNALRKIGAYRSGVHKPFAKVFRATARHDHRFAGTRSSVERPLLRIR